MEYTALGTLFIMYTLCLIQMGYLGLANKALKKRVKALERENAELKRAFDELFVKRRK